MIKALVNTPFPRPSIKTYALIFFSIGFIINFILVAFQPFGTAGWQDDNKLAILSGYGIVVFLVLTIFHIISRNVLHKNRAGRWNIILEVSDMFIGVFLSLCACYLYSNYVFSGTFRWHRFGYFMLNAGMVAMIPVSGYLVLIYSIWKGTRRSEWKPIDNMDLGKQDGTIILLGSNKSDTITTSIDQVLFLKSQDNYVLLHLLEGDKVKRHLLRATLSSMKEQVYHDRFFQSHRSYIINKDHIDRLEGNKSKSVLYLKHTDKKIPVARSAYDDLKSYKVS